MNKHYEKYKESIKAASKKYLAKNQVIRLVNNIKRNATLKGLEFNLGYSDVVIPEYCPYLGVRLTNITGQGRISSNASIDRIDSSKGYTKDNIQVISDLANRMKQNATKEELITFAKSILKMYT